MDAHGTKGTSVPDERQALFPTRYRAAIAYEPVLTGALLTVLSGHYAPSGAQPTNGTHLLNRKGPRIVPGAPGYLRESVVYPRTASPGVPLGNP